MMLFVFQWMWAALTAINWVDAGYKFDFETAASLVSMNVFVVGSYLNSTIKGK